MPKATPVCDAAKLNTLPSVSGSDFCTVQTVAGRHAVAVERGATIFDVAGDHMHGFLSVPPATGR